MEIVNHKTGHRVELRWKSAGWFSSGAHRVEGHIVDPSKRRLRALYGKWIEALYSVDVGVWEQYQQTHGGGSNSTSNRKSQGHASSSSEDDGNVVSCFRKFPNCLLLIRKAIQRPNNVIF